jgi:hypothetical protein
MTEAEMLERVRKVLGFGTAWDARHNLLEAAIDIDHNELQVCDPVSRHTISRVLDQLAEAEKLLQPRSS